MEKINLWVYHPATTPAEGVFELCYKGIIVGELFMDEQSVKKIVKALNEAKLKGIYPS